MGGKREALGVHMRQLVRVINICSMASAIADEQAVFEIVRFHPLASADCSNR